MSVKTNPPMWTVPEEKRLAFLPWLVGPHALIQFESLVYATAHELCPDYTGGYWEFCRINNGGYLRPTGLGNEARGKLVRVSVYGNGYDGEMSEDAFGIVVTLFALNALLWKTHDTGHDARYYTLRDFACDHPEARKILQAID